MENEGFAAQRRSPALDFQLDRHNPRWTLGSRSRGGRASRRFGQFIEQYLSDPRRGKNTPFPLADCLVAKLRPARCDDWPAKCSSIGLEGNKKKMPVASLVIALIVVQR